MIGVCLRWDRRHGEYWDWCGLSQVCFLNPAIEVIRSARARKNHDTTRSN